MSAVLALVPAAESLETARDPRIRPAPGPIAAEDRPVLELLRSFLDPCHLAGRVNVEQACALVAADPAAELERCGVALLHALDRYSPARFVFHRPGTRDVTFDEAWLVRLIRSAEAGDEASVRLLVHRKIAHGGRRHVAFLAARVAAARQELESF